MSSPINPKQPGVFSLLICDEDLVKLISNDINFPSWSYMNPPGLLAELSSVLTFSKYVFWEDWSIQKIKEIPSTHTQTPSILSTISFMYVSCAPCHHLLLTFRALEPWFLHQTYLRILKVDLYMPPFYTSNKKNTHTELLEGSAHKCCCFGGCALCCITYFWWRRWKHKNYVWHLLVSHH